MIGRVRSAATIADVASRARVGASTVSRVLNGGQVSEPARARVLSAIRDLDYRPRASARSLAGGSTGTLALVIPFFTHPSAVERLRGVLAAVDATEEYELVVCNVASPAQRDAYLGRRAPLDRSDGLLITSLTPTDEEADAFLAAGAPVVLLDAFHPRLPSLPTDDVAGGELATRHLIELGHRRIGFVGDRPDRRLGFVSSERRRAGHRRALSAAGIGPQPDLERDGAHDRLVAHRLTRELLSLDEPPTAIFAASDTQALGVLEAAGAEGFEVPGDLSVIGFDDLEVAPYVGLTTVRQALRESGELGVRRLLARLGGADEHGDGAVELPLELVARRTTAPPRAV
jgi:LacI family transcriptional regulator